MCIARWVLSSTRPTKRSLSKPLPQNAPDYPEAAPIITERGLLGIAFLTPDRVKRLVKFGLVGVSGVLVNVVVFEVLFRFGGLVFSVANAGGIALSVFSNFLLNDAWTWGDRQKGVRRRDWFARMGKYYISASIAAGVQLAVAWAANHYLLPPIHLNLPALFDAPAHGVDISPTLAVLSGIVVGMGINFVAGHLWAFRDVEVVTE